jgi:tetratricopeptide (TPR) repeat protein
MSISICPPRFDLSSPVIPANKLVGNRNPKAKVQDYSFGFYHQGNELYKSGKKRAARQKFLKMFDCNTLNVEDFENVGIILTNPSKNDFEIKLDMFAKKFLKQARELGSKNPLVYHRLSLLYYNNGDFKKSLNAAYTLKKLDPSGKNTISLLSKLYKHPQFGGSDHAVELGLELVQNKETVRSGLDIITNSIIRKNSKIKRSSRFKMVTTRYSTLKSGYFKLSSENRLKVAKLFHDALKIYCNKNSDRSPEVNQHRLVRSYYYGEIIISLAYMASVESDPNHEIYNKYLKELGFSKEGIKSLSTYDLNRYS